MALLEDEISFLVYNKYVRGRVEQSMIMGEFFGYLSKWLASGIEPINIFNSFIPRIGCTIN
ncbi:MAG: hypothetical protein Q8P05_03085 [Candidatus Diapherotrites archaeon]|nr:hypothetical protein [Candidatus Diapherotrites archaeon]